MAAYCKNSVFYCIENTILSLNYFIKKNCEVSVSINNSRPFFNMSFFGGFVRRWSGRGPVPDGGGASGAAGELGGQGGIVGTFFFFFFTYLPGDMQR